jgi:outer membrane protein TolC
MKRNRFNKMSYIILLITAQILWSIPQTKAQTTLDECQRLAEQNYPLIRDYGLIEKSTNYSLSNVSRTWLPQLSLSMQATYQSDVATFPAELLKVYSSMGLNMKGLDKDQYRAALELTQTIWDGGSSIAAKRTTEAGSAVERASTAVTMYGIRNRVNSLFFGALLAEAQAKQNQLRQELLQSNLLRIRSCISNGVAMQYNADAIEAELLAAHQQHTRIEASLESYLAMLSLFSGKKITQIATPCDSTVDLSDNQRPELDYMRRLEEQYTAQAESVRASVRPNIGLSFQGFYGNPGLNLFKDMAENHFTWNYLAGIKIQWRFGSYYTKHNRLQMIELARNRVNVQRETFLFNTRLQTTQGENTVKSLRRELADDNRIISLRESVRRAYESKLGNGVAEATDLLREITSESDARMNQERHKIELLKAIYDLKYMVNR